MKTTTSFNSSNISNKDCWTTDDPRLLQYIQSELTKLQQSSNNNGGQQHQMQMITEDGTTLRIPPLNMGNIVTGMSRVNRDEFANQFDMGVPLDPSTTGNRDVLLLYSGAHALPSTTSNPFIQHQMMYAGSEIPMLSSVDEATENCDNLHVVLTHPQRDKQCIAIMGQYEAFHIQKYMRLPEEGSKDGANGKKLDSNLPLRIVNRGAQATGRKSTEPPTREQTLQHWSVLTTYLQTFQDVVAKLEPIAQKVAYNKKAIIVMVCNFGQSQLLMNFVCNCRTKQLSTEHVLVFATDIETKELAESLGLTAFYDETNFGRMPKKAAKRYADKNFMAMMSAKVYCVQMISMLGYDVLFQDVDVVWYQDPLPYFHQSPNLPISKFDIYFQDDGNHALYYAPYSANTGFYYVRHNDRTQYFFNSLLMAGDLILSTHSHQIALIALLNEHASMYNLKVKIFERNTEEFPGGFTFHRKKSFMMDLFHNKVKPYIFHMSWTNNKDNKQKFFQQIGEWYVENQCIDKTVKQIADSGITATNGGDNIAEGCCSIEPLISCHYMDKPSKIPCKDSPAIDKNGRSWW